MTTPTFTWAPLVQPTGTVTLRVLSAQFGDGYKQTAANGINNKGQSWPLSFAGSASEITSIMDFLDERAGWQSFYWTPPLGSQGLYRCANYSPQPVEGDTYRLTATFEQAFQP